MEETTPTLRGFNGRVLSCPSMPQAIALSFARILWIVAALVVSTAPGLIVGRSGPKWTQQLALGWFIAIALTFGRSGTLVLQFWRFRYLFPRFSIIALRPFHNRDTSYLYRNLVAPVLGCYGSVTVVSDRTFAATERTVDDATFDLSEMGDAPLALTFTDDEWKKNVLGYIAISDFAVIDLTLPSVNLLWEVASCVQLLPPHRVFIIGVKTHDWDRRMSLVREYLEEFLPDGGHSVNLQPPIEYGGRVFGTWRFRVGIFRAMRALRRLDQTVAANGTWHALKTVAPPTMHGVSQ
jgi:hypothetical protein